MVVICSIAGDHRQPRSETFYLAKHGQPPKGNHEDVLNEVIDLVEGNPSEQNSVDHPCISVIELAKRRSIPVTRRTHK
jgi:hypothetical protein